MHSARPSLGALVLALAGICSYGPAQSPAGPGIPWASSVSEAFARAKSEKKPVLWVVMKDEEIACKRMMKDIYGNAGIVDRLADVVLLPSSPALHVPIRIRNGDQEIDSCPHYVGRSCAEHQLIELEFRTRFVPQGVVVAPQHVLCDPDGKIVVRKEYEMKRAEFLAWIDAGVRKFRGEPEPAAPPVPPAGEAGAPTPPAAPTLPLPPGVAPPTPAAAPAPGDAASTAMTPELQSKLALLTSAPEEQRITVAQDLARSGNAEAIKGLVDALLGSEIKPEALRFKILRALGGKDYAAAAPEFTRLLELKPKELRDAAVVSLEEMENGAAAKALLAHLPKEKDPEVRKDVVRALGPAAPGDPAAREVLLGLVKGKDATLKVAAAMALGSHLSSSDEVRPALRERWKKDAANDQMKIAILWAYWLAKDKDAGKDVVEFAKGEKNDEIQSTAEAVMASLGVTADDPGRNGRGGRGGAAGRGGRGGPFGAQMTLFRTFGRLFADDKIERNAVKQLREQFGRGRNG